MAFKSADKENNDRSAFVINFGLRGEIGSESA
jgi:hypothetical protein